MHLTPEQLVDIAEGTQPQALALNDVEGHLASCEACRRQLADLRSMMAAVAEDEVPEPSPLFWDHFSARVNDAVAAEPRGWDWSWARLRMPIALAASAVLVIAVLGVRLIAPHESVAPPSSVVFVAEPPPASAGETLATEVTDPSLALVADLTEDIGWDEARDAGLAPRGSAEYAVTHLSEGELRQLRDLLQEAMASSSD